MKILSIVPYKIFPSRTGGEKGIALFNKYIAFNCDLTCVTVKSNEPRFSNNYRILNILSNSRFRYINPFYFFTLLKIIRNDNISHLILEHPYFGWLGIVLKKVANVKLIIHSHNIESTRWKTLGKWWWKILFVYEKIIHRNADYNFFIQDSDKEFAIRQYKLRSERCLTVTYGIEWETIPAKEELQYAKDFIHKTHNISDDELILLFNGAFGYKPNLEALLKIVNIIDPLLQRQQEFQYKIVICGKDIPDYLSKKQYPNLIFAGFVDDISLYFKGSDIFLNPITEGGGIKTKMVEALAYNLTVVSTISGAIGVNPNWCNGKLLITGDNNWQAFAELIVWSANIHNDVPDYYFENFYWGNIVEKAIDFIKKDIIP